MRPIRLTLLLATTLLAAGAPLAAHAAAPQSPDVAATAPSAAPQPVIASDFPDPDLLAVDGTYYAYATNAAGSNVQVASSPSLPGSWTARPDALPELGAWAREGLTWAPDVSALPGGGYVLYYTARDIASDRQCVGVATASSPLGPFTPRGDGPLVCPAAEGGAIDAATFTDGDGARYLLWKNDGNAIGADTWLHLQRVTGDGLSLLGEPARLLRQDRAEEYGLVEAPTLVKHGGTYVLMYSAGRYGDGTYFTGYATAPALTGPYTKSAEPLMASGEGITGPGGQDVVSDGTRDWIAHHGVLSGDPLVRGMYVRALEWDGDRPVVP